LSWNALIYSADLIRNNDIATIRRIIDVSTYLENFRGIPIELARDTVVQSGVTIHGLVIACSESERPTSGNCRHRTLKICFAQVIICGAGTFVVVAGEYLCFAQAVQRKLIL
jgi:hypothetical protein